MVNDPNYAVPYGEVTISGTFPYLHQEPQSEDDKITISNEYVIMDTFVTGTFGNNNDISVINPSAADKVFSYAQISHFKDAPDTENITFVQTYQGTEVKYPSVHLVTTITEPGLDYTLGLGEWTTEARIFVKGTKSDGTVCDHAFGIGSIKINDISWELGATTISLEGSATLYSYKATPDYGGNISDDEEWIACDPQ